MTAENFRIPECLRCPLCGHPLERSDGSAACTGERRHNYDIAKEGYLSLLPPGRARNSKTGDDAEMIRARAAFLGGGGYDRYSAEAVEFAAKFMDHVPESGAVLVDAGCGEGRHTVNMASHLASAIKAPVTALGFDASKFGVRAAAKRYVRGECADGVTPFFATANIFHLPVASECADIFTSLFAPLPDDKARRVLKPGGVLLICAAGADHLREMREIIYENVIPSGGGAAVPDGFDVAGEKTVSYKLPSLSRDEVMSLFTMTPFYYNAPAEGRMRLENTQSLAVTVQVKCTAAVRRDI